MKISWTRALPFGLIALAFIATIVVYGELPARIPTHWRLDGTVDATMAKPMAPFLVPLIMAAVFGLMRLFPHIAPRGYRMEPFAHAYESVQLGIIAFLFGLDILILLAGLGYPIPLVRWVLAGHGLLLIVIGNIMGKLTPNFFIGVRTPWTLADPEVWLRTHRFAGKLFVLDGLATVILALIGIGLPWLLVSTFAAAFVAAAYSYVIYRRLDHGHGEAGQ